MCTQKRGLSSEDTRISRIDQLNHMLILLQIQRSERIFSTGTNSFKLFPLKIPQRDPCHAEVQASYPMSEHYINTEVTQTVSTASNHVEGGWPKDVNPNEMEQVARYRKKVEKDEAYISTILKLAAIAEDVIRSNNAIDIYEDYSFEEQDDTAYDATPRARLSSKK